jgi:F-type H+-transporting ATPase subunit b
MATEAAHTEVPGGHKGTFPPFDPSTFASQLVWLAIAFVLFYVLMSRLALPRIRGIIENRDKTISDNLAEAQNLKTQSDAAVAAYEKALADARSRAQAIANETRAKQAAEAEKERKALEERLNVRLADADRSIAATKAAAMGNVHGIASDAAKSIVERLIGKAPDDKKVDEAVASVLKS